MLLPQLMLHLLAPLATSLIDMLLETWLLPWVMVHLLAPLATSPLGALLETLLLTQPLALAAAPSAACGWWRAVSKTVVHGEQDWLSTTYLWP